MYLYCLTLASEIFGKTLWFSGSWKLKHNLKRQGSNHTQYFCLPISTFSIALTFEWSFQDDDAIRQLLPGRRQVHSWGGSWHNEVLNTQYPQVFRWMEADPVATCQDACPWSGSEQEMAAEAAWRNWGERRRLELKSDGWLPKYLTRTWWNVVV